MYTRDIKIFGKKKEKRKKKQETRIQTIRIYSQFIVMELVIEMGAILIMKSGKREITEGIKLQNQERIITLREKENYIWEYWNWTPSKKQRWK